MNPAAISAIATGISGAVNRAHPDPDWPDDVQIVPEGDPLAAELEDELFVAADPDSSFEKAEAAIAPLPN